MDLYLVQSLRNIVGTGLLSSRDDVDYFSDGALNCHRMKPSQALASNNCSCLNVKKYVYIR